MSSDILLGFTDKNISPSKVQTTLENNFLGHKIPEFECQPICQKCYAKNKNVHFYHFVLKIYCPIDDDFHRILYLLVCHSCGDWVCLRRLERYTEEEGEAEAGKTNNETGMFEEDQGDWGEDAGDEEAEAEDDWGDEAGDEAEDDWGDENANAETAASKSAIVKTDTSNFQPNPEFFPSSLQNSTLYQAAIAKNKTKVHINGPLFKPFKPYYIYVENESDLYAGYDDTDETDSSLAGSFPASSTSKATASIDTSDGGMGDGLSDRMTLSLNLADKTLKTVQQNNQNLTQQETKKYEDMIDDSENETLDDESKVAYGDEILFQFIEYFRYMPDQILRYSCTRDSKHIKFYNQKCQKILKSRNFQQKSQICAYCGSGCKFEMQVFPKIAFDLIENGDDAFQDRKYLVNGLPDFGSVYIFTCGKDCWDEYSGEEFRVESCVFVAQDSLK